MKQSFIKTLTLILITVLAFSCANKHEFATSKRQYGKGYYIATKRSVNSTENKTKPETLRTPSVLTIVTNSSAHTIVERSSTTQTASTVFKPAEKRKVSKRNVVSKIHSTKKENETIVRSKFTRAVTSSSEKMKQSPPFGNDSSDPELWIGILLAVVGVIGFYIGFVLMTGTAAAASFGLGLLIVSLIAMSIGFYIIRSYLFGNGFYGAGNGTGFGIGGGTGCLGF